MKKWVYCFIVLGCIFTFIWPAVAMEKFITFATGGIGGTLHIIAVGNAKLFNECLKGEARVNVQSTGGGTESTRLVGKGEAYLSNCVDTPVVVEGYEGKGRFKGEQYPDLRVICSFPYGPTHVFTLLDSGIKSIQEFKGKRISLGAAGSTGAVLGERILKTYGFDVKKDMTVSYHTVGAQASALRDGAIDAGFVFTPAPIGTLTEVSLTKPIRLIPIDATELDKLLKEIPGSTKMVFPAGVYKGVDQEVIGIGTIMQFITNQKVSEEAIYKITKCLWETLDEFHKVHPLAKSFQKKTALQDLSIPLHKGAERYYREVGMMK